MKQKRFGNVLPVRLPIEVADGLRRVAKAAGVTKSDALRMAIAHGLPSLEAGKIKLKKEAA